ncbi:hypothetical protein MKX01_005771 [Papaver californicum]|nr:hypothetical protein MKX01_005771 [Papaver californicum]
MEMKDGNNSLMYKLTPLLKLAGHRVTVLDLAASGINPADLVKSKLFNLVYNTIPRCISIKQELKEILVGHSLGGLVISKAMETFPEKISVAVFLTAFMPNTLQEIKYPDIFKEGSMGDSIYTYDEGGKETSTDFMFGPGYISSKLYDLSSSELIKLFTTTLARPIRVFTSEDMSKQMRMSKQKYGSVKRVYIISELDKGIPKDFQRWIIEKDSVHDVKQITGSDHMVMMSKRHELFACIHEIAGEA